MSRLVASRFQIEFTLIELDEWNEPVGEHPQATVVLYGINQVRCWLDVLPAMINKTEQEVAQDGGNTTVPAAVP